MQKCTFLHILDKKYIRWTNHSKILTSRIVAPWNKERKKNSSNNHKNLSDQESFVNCKLHYNKSQIENVLFFGDYKLAF